MGCSQFIKHCLCHSFLLKAFSSSSVGSLPQKTLLHELPECESFLNVSPSHGQQELLQQGVQSFRKNPFPFKGCSPSGAACCSVGHIPVRKLAAAGASLSMGSQVLPRACSSTGFRCGHSLRRAHPPALV